MTTRTKKKETTFTAESIQKQIEKFEQERDMFLEQANRQIAMLDGAIQGLKSMLNGQEEENTATDPDETAPK